MSLDKSFYMDEKLGLDLKQPITKVDMTIEPGCIISILAVGNTDQDTYRSEIHEIHLPPAPAHM